MKEAPQKPAPFGSWPSLLSAELVGSATLRLSLPRIAGDFVTWLEGRPAESGRQVVMRMRPGAAPEELTPRGMNVRSRVHEYGGGDYTVAKGRVFAVDADEPGIFRMAPAGRQPVAGTLASARYADFAVSNDGRWLAAVEEEHREGAEPLNRLVLLSLRGNERRVIDDAHDFVSSPCFSPDGRRLAWLAWDHPQLPWDGTTLLAVSLGDAGRDGAPRPVAGGPTESVFQPSFSPDGRLTFVADRRGWWNLFQERGEQIVPLARRQAEFGLPQWQLGMSTYGFLDAKTLLCVRRSAGFDRLAQLDAESGALRDLDLGYAVISGIAVQGRRAVFIGASPQTPAAVCHLDLRSGRVEELRRSVDLDLPPGSLASPETLSFATGDGETAHAFLYRPTNKTAIGPLGELPPLLVKVHGGPTAAASPALDPALQYWTSRGFAVADVDYRGSSGYGRAYRERLRGNWGVIDLEDCTRAARYLASEGLVDPERMGIRGSSAGGFTVLSALTFGDTFAAGASYYGIGDLEALAAESHKFESRYLDGLVGPLPEAAALYRERSPVQHVERLSRPVIFFQGLEDRVVPPSQAESMVVALRGHGVPHAYVTFSGEGHGFRRAEHLRSALEKELFFYGFVFEFPVDAALERVEIAV